MTEPAETTPRNPIAVLYLPLLLVSLSFAFLSFALPFRGVAMGASALEIGGLFSAWALMVALLRPLVGWGLDRIGRRPFFVVATLCFTASMFIFALSGSIFGLYLGQVVRGLGSALLWISAYTLATELAAGRQYGESVGYVDQSSAQGQLYGGIAGFVIFSMLPEALGWQVIFAGYTLLAGVGAYLGWKSVPETRPPSLQVTKSRERVPGMLYRLMAIVFVTAASTAMLTPIFLIFLQDRFELPVRYLVLAIIPAGVVASYLPARLGRISDRYGRPRLMALGLVISAGVSFLLPHMPSILVLAVVWTVESLGWAIAAPAEEAMVADITGHSVRGVGYGLYTFAASLGAVFGPLVGGWLYDQVGQPVPFYLNSVILLVGAVLVLVLLRGSSAPVEAEPAAE